jgi:RHS repeat-associated protein
MIFDQSGSLTVVDQNGNYVSGMTRHDYLPFGEELFTGTSGRTPQQGYGANDNLRQHFTQKERDNETALDYSINRYYSSTQGRFTSPDPGNAGADVGDPQSWNGYAYSLNNPLRYIDPDGLRWAQATVDGGIQYQWFDDDEKDANGQTAYGRALGSGWSAVTFNGSGTLSFTNGLLAPGETLTTVTLSENSPTASVSSHVVTLGEWTKWLYLNTFSDLAFGTHRETAQLNDFVSSIVGVQTNASGDGPAVAGPALGNVPEGPPHPRDTARKRGNELVERFKKAGEGVGRSGGGGEKYRKAGAELIREANKVGNNVLREAMKKEGKRLINYGRGVSHK